MYEPPSSLAAFLPLTFEWNVAAIVLALCGIIAGGWLWLLTVPLLLTWTLCVNGAFKAPIDKRFRGLKARALIALLIYLGPILRGWERARWRIRLMKTNDQMRLDAAADSTGQKARVDWRERSFFLAYWSERGDEKELLLGGLMAFLAPQKYFIMPDQGWSDWDLKIARGLWSRAYVMVVGENHGGMKRLLRVRCEMRLSRLSAFMLRCYAVLAAAALILDAPAVAAAIGAVGIGHFGFIAYRTWAFGGLMRRIIDAVAKQAQLTPVEPEERPAVPVLAPRTA
jgi:O-antigen biosynthesis protein